MLHLVVARHLAPVVRLPCAEGARELGLFATLIPGVAPEGEPAPVAPGALFALEDGREGTLQPTCRQTDESYAPGETLAAEFEPRGAREPSG